MIYLYIIDFHGFLSKPESIVPPIAPFKIAKKSRLKGVLAVFANEKKKPL